MKISQARWIASAALFAALSVSLGAAAKLASTGASTAGFRASGPGGINIDGKSTDVRVADDGSTVTITVGLGALDTGMSLRDKHTREALEVDQFAAAELKVARSELKFPAAGAESSGDAKGKLKIHGQTKDVTFHYTAGGVGGVGGGLNVKGSARINMTDFGIKPPSYLGVGVKPDVEINVSFQAKDG
jgi:polyisoprenoid-binding protein YceI